MITGFTDFLVKTNHHLATACMQSKQQGHLKQPFQKCSISDYCRWTSPGFVETTPTPLLFPLATNTQSALKEINLEYSLEGLTLKLKLQFFGHLIQRTYSLEKTLMLGKIEGKRRRGWKRMNWLDSITNSMDVNLSKPSRRQWRTEETGVLQFKGS